MNRRENGWGGRRTERAVRRGEAFFRAVFDLATVGIARLSLDGHWLLVNQKLCDILGYCREEFDSLTLEGVTLPEDLTRHTAELRAMQCGELSSCSRELLCLRKDGSSLWIKLAMTLVRDAAGEPDCFLALLEDIDERKRAEQELRNSEAKFRQIFRLAPIGISISTLEEGRFVDFNEAAERLSGYRRDEVVGRCAQEFEIWRKPAERAAVVEEVLSKGEVRNRELVMTDKEGRPFWGLYSATVVEIAGERQLLSLVSDIGERKRAEAALRESEERFRLLADHAPVMIWEAGPDSRCTFINQFWLDFTGRTLKQELGDGWSQGVHPDDQERCLTTYRTAFKEGKAFSMEYRLRRADGGYGWIHDTGVPRLSAKGKVLGYLGTGFDVTDQKRIEEELQEANELLSLRVAERTVELTETIRRLKEEMAERVRIGDALKEQTAQRLTAETELREKELMLLHQGRLAAMGEMIGNIAHQWRQPLNLLGMLIQELAMTWKRGECTPDYLDKSVRKMRETLQHMSQTIGDFSNFFRPAKEKVEFRVRDSVDKTLSLLEPTLRAQQIRTVLIQEGEPALYGYPNELSQVLLNIIANARDALVAGAVPEPVITIVLKNEGERTVITVTDNAGGVPEAIIDRIFEPYFSTKPQEQGTGVGLFMSRTIIEKNMGGSLSVRNVDGGAQFRIEI